MTSVLKESLANSRPLDLCLWSDHQNVQRLCEQVRHALTGKLSQRFEEQLRVLLLNLFVVVADGRNQKIGVAMSPNEYKAKDNRYNPAGISSLMIEAIQRLRAAGLIEFVPGYHDHQTKSGFRSRIWATEPLIALFKENELVIHMLMRHPGEEVIIRKNDRKEPENYLDTADTLRMRDVVKTYNKLLASKHIDIRSLDEPRIDLKDGSTITIGPHRQHAYRVFNRPSFSKGGRFYGPWWQACPKEWRRKIVIDDAPTVEEDYSSLHIALLYARKQINFYSDYGGDAYQLDTPSFLQSAVQTRRYCKLLLLMAVNADSDKKAFSAFRSDRREEEDNVGQSLSDKQLSVLLTGLREKLPHIAEFLGSGAGIDLMYEDSQITEYVIESCTKVGIPVLTIHDSYIVSFDQANFLRECLSRAFERVTGFSNIRSERVGVVIDDDLSWQYELPIEDRKMTNGYKQRHIDWMCNREIDVQ